MRPPSVSDGEIVAILADRKGKVLSANPSEVSTRATSESERAQLAAEVESAEGFQAFTPALSLSPAYLNTTVLSTPDTSTDVSDYQS